jgi:hypothetical protein
LTGKTGMGVILKLSADEKFMLRFFPENLFSAI